MINIVVSGYVVNHATGEITSIEIVATDASYYARTSNSEHNKHLEKTENILNTERLVFHGLKHFDGRLKIDVLEEYKTVFLKGKKK